MSVGCVDCQQQLQAVIHQEREAATVVGPSASVAESTPALSEIKRTGVPLASALQVVSIPYGVTSVYMMGIIPWKHRGMMSEPASGF